MNVSYDTWNGNRNEGGSTIIFPDKATQISDLLNRLDQKKFTQIILEGDESFLIVGGGNGKYVCTLTIGEHEEFYNLINSNGGDEEVDIVTGGQLGTFPEKIVNNYDDTLEAMKYYALHQEMIPQLQWENE